MRRLYPQIPDGVLCETVGFLVESDNVDDLSVDMLEVSLPNGILIAAGWSAEGDPDGHYVISATCGLDDVVPEITAKDADCAIREVERLAVSYAQDARYCSSDAER